ncbi:MULTISPECIES: alpha/beta hydrolase [Pseudomonas]|uniref:alpha/beta hydrolase n=1 Tax=Pseudomonas TaxID=286 RepID=UPI00224AB7C1|nr:MULTISPECIES: alpha/beta hydrolase [unclassified Pseudomonas]MCX2888427.1 alpha/beta hydrolase [Pseudomonas sp. DCB_BI]MDH4549348.1 alpha/beta hydrolase [Pseudomonas sp. BN607]
MSRLDREELLIDGGVGKLHLLLDHPPTPPKGVAIVSHPQPLLGGSPRHIVPVTLARQLCASGWLAVRPSFRGVGLSEGSHDGGIGETEDSLAVLQHMAAMMPGLPIALVGFSFGAHVFARLASASPGAFDALALLGLPVGDVPGGRHYPAPALPDDCLLVHGECDQMAPLPSLLGWAAGEQRRVSVYAGADHFFKGCLGRVAEEVCRYLQYKRPESPA